MRSATSSGDPVAIIVDFAIAVVGVWFGAAGVTGYSTRPLGPALRAAFVVAGVCLLIPLGASDVARWINLLGAALAAALFVGDQIARRRATAAGPSVAPDSTRG